MGRHFRRWPSPLGLAVVLVLLVTLAGPFLQRWSVARRGESEPSTGSTTVGARVLLAGGSCEIVSVLDSRTLIVQQGSPAGLFRVRLLGIAPIDAAWASQAAQELEKIAPPGPAFIELDKRRSADDGSWLANVYLHNRLLSNSLIRAGWGRYEPHSGDSFDTARLLCEAEKQARQEKRGMWAE